MFSFLFFFSYKGINQHLFSKQNTAKATVSKGVPIQTTRKPDLQKKKQPPNTEFREGKTLPTSHPLRAKGIILSCAVPSSFFTTGTLHGLPCACKKGAGNCRCHLDGISSLWTLTHQGAPLIPRGLCTGAVRYASPLLLKLEEDGPCCPVPSIPV